MCPSVLRPCKKQAGTSLGEHAALASISTGSLYLITVPLCILKVRASTLQTQARMQVWLEILHTPPQLS